MKPYNVVGNVIPSRVIKDYFNVRRRKQTGGRWSKACLPAGRPGAGSRVWLMRAFKRKGGPTYPTVQAPIAIEYDER